MVESHYKAFIDNVRDLENMQKALASAEDVHTLNQREREAQKLLFFLQHTAMGLGYWIQDTTRARRKELSGWNNIEKKVETPIEVVVEKPKPAKRQTKKKRSKKNATKE